MDMIHCKKQTNKECKIRSKETNMEGNVSRDKTGCLDKIAVSVTEAAKMLGVSRTTMYNLAKQEGFPCVMIGHRMLIPLKGLNEWIDQNSKG